MLVLAFAAPAGAAPKHGGSRPRSGSRAHPDLNFSFEVEGSAGYRVYVAAARPWAGRPGLIGIWVWDSGNFAGYATRGTVDTGGFSGSFGKLGSVSISFLWAPDLSEATVAPPPPFSGSATLKSPRRGRPRLRGDLAVQFPGLEPRPLIDDESTGSLFHGTCTGTDGGSPAIAWGC